MRSILCACALYLPYVIGKEMKEMSFDGPYDTVMEDGKRGLGDNWIVGNAASVKQHFVRLTPDRQSKRGYLWNKAVLNNDEFSAVVQFRISGQGKRWFGDGIGIWITQHDNYQYGINHGRCLAKKKYAYNKKETCISYPFHAC